MNRRLLIITMVLLVLVLAIALTRGVIREAIVMPLLGLVWGIVQLIESLPQALLWWFVIAFVVVLAVRSIGGSTGLRMPTRPAEAIGGRVASWMRVIAFARRDGYSRWRMAQRFALLAQELIAYRDGIDMRQARRRLESGAGLPPAVAAYLRAGLIPHRPPTNLIARFRAIGNADPLTLDPQIVATALQQLRLDGE
jgi:GNAT superfamily N-acetyltransferase